MQAKFLEAKFLIALLAVSSLVVAAPTLEARTKPKANEYDSSDWYVNFLRYLAVRLQIEHLWKIPLPFPSPSHYLHQNTHLFTPILILDLSLTLSSPKPI